MLSELLLPGAQLAGPALRLYAGPGAAAAAGAAESDRALPGYNFLPVLSSLKAAAASNMPARAGLGTSSLSARSTAQSSQQEQSITVSSQVGQELVSTIVAACLRVSETVSWSCYYFYMLQSKGTGVPAPGELTGTRKVQQCRQGLASACPMHDAPSCSVTPCTALYITSHSRMLNTHGAQIRCGSIVHGLLHQELSAGSRAQDLSTSFH